MFNPVYDATGNLIGVQDSSTGTSIPAAIGNRDWDAYVAQKGMPALTGAPTVQQPPLPAAVQNAVTQVKAFQINSTPTLADAISTIKAQNVLLKYLYAQLLS